LIPQLLKNISKINKEKSGEIFIAPESLDEFWEFAKSSGTSIFQQQAEKKLGGTRTEFRPKLLAGKTKKLAFLI